MLDRTPDQEHCVGRPQADHAALHASSFQCWDGHLQWQPCQQGAWRRPRHCLSGSARELWVRVKMSLFQNISAAAPSVLGQQDTLWGMEEGHIYDLLFQNVRIGGKLVDSVEHFLTNEYVFDIKFAI